MSANIAIALSPVTFTDPVFIISTFFPAAPASVPYPAPAVPVASPAIPTLPGPAPVTFIIPSFFRRLPFVPYIPAPLSTSIIPVAVLWICP